MAGLADDLYRLALRMVWPPRTPRTPLRRSWFGAYVLGEVSACRPTTDRPVAETNEMPTDGASCGSRGFETDNGP